MLRVCIDDLLLPETGATVRAMANDTDYCDLHCTDIRWTCANNTPLHCRLLSDQALPLIDAQADEPVEGALARIVQAYAFPRAVILLLNPNEAFGAERMLYAQGVSLCAIESDANEQCWDAMLAKGLPCFGVRGALSVVVRQCDPMSVLTALAYGIFTCSEGLTFKELEEDRKGVRWQVSDEGAEVRVIIKEGFEAACFGAHGEWHDRGTEGTVRLVAASPAGQAWSQPRFIMPLPLSEQQRP